MVDVHHNVFDMYSLKVFCVSVVMKVVLVILHHLSHFYSACLLHSWIQTQLKNHPDELWEDGVRDYLDHASSIMVILHVV